MMSYLDDMFGLDGQVAVVTGGGGVLGGAIGTGLARAGAKVAVLDLDPDSAHAQAEAIRSGAGGDALAVRVDASREEELAAARDEVLARCGRVDVVVNAAGINSATPFFEISEQEWQKILDVNLKGTFLSCQVFGGTLVDQGTGGSIINISSASSGPPLSRVFTYGISKAGVNNLTRFLAREWAPHDIRVNAIVPGFFPAEQNRKILTEERVADIMRHTPMDRFGQPDELAGAVLWLASGRASSFVTGALIRVDGGYTAMTI